MDRERLRPARSLFSGFAPNGRDIFAKGANWIPSDPFIHRATPSVYRHLLGSTVAGQHEHGARVGRGLIRARRVLRYSATSWASWSGRISRWRAPSTRTPKSSSASSREKLVTRCAGLHTHASLALLCGDNEGAEASPVGGNISRGTASGAAYTKTAPQLKKVCEPKTPRAASGSRAPRTTSSAASPPIPSAATSTIGRCGTVASRFTTISTVRPRFVSEFGFQSFPEPRTLLREVIPVDQRNPSSRVMEHHQRSPDGNLRITDTMAREMPIPRDFDSFRWVSQINQAMAIRTAVEHWRRLKPWCMGALFWQLNDLWPVASWSSIDYHGRWKALQHEAARFFAPSLVSFGARRKHAERMGDVRHRATAPSPHSPRARHRHLGRPNGRPRASRRSSRGRREPAHRPVFGREVARGSRAAPSRCFARIAGGGRGAENHATLVPWKWGTTVPKPKLRASLRAAPEGVVLVVTTNVVTPFLSRASWARGALRRRLAGPPAGAHLHLPLGAPSRTGSPNARFGRGASGLLRIFTSLYDFICAMAVANWPVEQRTSATIHWAPSLNIGSRCEPASVG